MAVVGRAGGRPDLTPVVTRWGTTSFDVTVTGSVTGRPVFEACLVYVNVMPGTSTPCPVEDAVRAALS